MDQAALQRVTLARSSGTLCWTARGAREQQSLRTWIGSFFFGVDGAAGPLGGWVEFVLGCDDAMHCAGIVLRRRHSGSTWTVLQVIFQLGALWLCTFEKLLSSCGRRPVFTQRFAESACCDRIVLPEWRILTGHLPCLMWLSLPLPRSCSPQGGRYNCNLAANNLLFLLLNPPFCTRQKHFVLNWTPEQELVRGLWEARMQWCTANACLCCLSATTIKNACFTFLGSNQFVWCIFLWVAT